VADITIEVTSPGTLTTWSQSSWGSASWGQISGLSSEQNSADILIDVSSDVTGQQLNSTSNIVSITADAILTLDTNLLTTFVGDLTAGQSQEVEVTSPGDLPWGSEAWSYGSWGNIGGMDISIGQDTVLVPSVEVDVTGNQLNTTTGTFSITGDASLTLTGISSDIITGTVNAQIDFDAAVTGQSIATTVATVSITADANIDVNGSLLTVSLGDEEVDIAVSVFLTGNAISLSLGTAELDANTLVNVTSVSAITTINSVSITIDVAPSITGLQMTTYTGTVFISAWAVVDIGITNNWAVVDIAA
jgi:hypothetical protein